MNARAAGPIVIGALFSGGGRTILNLLDEIDAGRLDARIVAAVASNGEAGGIARLRARGVPVEVLTRREWPDDEERSDRLDAILTEAGVELVCLCGYLRAFRVGERWAGRVLNIHPALLPRHGGKGMYGVFVHRAVLSAGDAESGCTVHEVDEEYDHGPVVVQRRCPVLPTDTPESLAARVFEEEKVAYPEAIRRVAERLRGGAGLNHKDTTAQRREREKE